MLFKQLAKLTLIGAALLASGCHSETVAVKHHPAKIDSTDVKGIMRVTLDARAAERIGLQTALVRSEQVALAGNTQARDVVPYGALMYDTKGDTWTYISLEPLVFVRKPVVVKAVVGDLAILTQGPSAGTRVVTVGAAELMAAEHKYGQ
jgi:hypothetical protein